MLERGAQLRVGGVALGERHIGQRAVEPGEQLAQRTQTLQLAGPEDAVALRRARRLDQAGALYVAQHSRRPAGRLRCLVDREPLHRGPKLNTIVSRLIARPPRSSRLSPSVCSCRAGAPTRSSSALTRSTWRCTRGCWSASHRNTPDSGASSRPRSQPTIWLWLASGSSLQKAADFAFSLIWV